MTEAGRWLSPREQDVWRSYLHAQQALREALDQQIRRDAGMPHAYYQILVALSECEGRRTSMTNLAGKVGSSPSRLSHAVNRLGARGWVSRHRDQDNRRIVLASLTEQGFAALAAAAPGHVREVRRMIFDRLNPEQLDALAAVTAAMTAEPGPA
ncbi:MarR family winged helix-turn-helix transcriptional regulator [Actinoalloteichus sp. GBA129-24]|uniref:MarR family winged helix-turn-helix transcriptional regulator n=1 Tax=Actinoalloteichus sp. GBA129-24 TaxID=1612551 RepID=UPI0009504EBF|nr:MarR family winged helix-turn-helix transcriptional regulator [Actinoalloteichus sp. GBA129-24]APU20877.1 transcriptional regulator, MarR family [Actinoalloteichus sp. GBA129-24]